MDTKQIACACVGGDDKPSQAAAWKEHISREVASTQALYTNLYTALHGRNAESPAFGAGLSLSQ